MRRSGRRASAGAHGGSGGQGVKRGVTGGKEEIRRVFALRHRAEGQAVGQAHGHVLHAVHGHIGRAGEQGVLDFLDEKPLPADFGEGDVKNDVPSGLDDLQFHVKAGVRGHEPIPRVFRLPERQAASARGNGECFHVRPRCGASAPDDPEIVRLRNALGAAPIKTPSAPS